jgi:hypothetical protein
LKKCFRTEKNELFVSKHLVSVLLTFINENINFGIGSWLLRHLIFFTYFYLFGCFLSLTLREKHRLRVFENRVLRRTYGSKRDEVTGEWRKLHSEEFHNLYLSPIIIRRIKSRRIRWTEHVARMGEERKVFKVL